MRASLATVANRQRGVGSLAVALLLLFGMTMVAFFANRGMIFEQRASANQYRATRAFEAAEAGIEWALTRINDKRCIDTSLTYATCNTGTGVISYRQRYLNPNPAVGAFAPPSNRLSGCAIATDTTTRAVTLNCHAPLNTTLNLAGAATNPRFTIEWLLGPDGRTVELISRGCLGQGAPCDGTGTPEATAVVRVLLRVAPDVPSAPGSGLTAGGVAITAGSIKVVNTNRESNGITINTGSNVVFSSGLELVTTEGSSIRGSVLDNDTALAALATQPDDFFKQYFGKIPSEYRSDEQTILLTGGGSNFTPGSLSCGNALDCGTAVSWWFDQGERNFWMQGDVAFNTTNMPTTTTGNTLGASGDPVLLAGSGDVKFNADIVGYGLFYSATATAAGNTGASGTGSATIFGAVVTNGNFCKVNNGGSCASPGSGSFPGNLTIVYDPLSLTQDGLKGHMVRVPGSWRDSLNNI